MDNVPGGGPGGSDRVGPAMLGGGLGQMMEDQNRVDSTQSIQVRMPRHGSGGPDDPPVINITIRHHGTRPHNVDVEVQAEVEGRPSDPEYEAIVGLLKSLI